MTRRSRNLSDGPIVALGRWQLTGVALGFGVIVVLVFLAGVIVGRQSSAPLPQEIASLTGGSASYAAAPARADGPHVGTRSIDAELSRPLQAVVPRDPSDAARIETHRQLRNSRAFGIMGVGGPTEGGLDGAMIAPTVTAGAGKGYTLQVSAFETKEPAALVASELDGAGHPSHLRRVESNGRAFWRVEVGHFERPEDAARFQRDFESKSGYSAVLVPTH